MWIHIPYSATIDWPERETTDASRRGPELWITTSIFFTLTIVSVVTRLHARLFVRRWFGPDDILILLALLTTIGTSICVALGEYLYGWNGHMWNFPLALETVTLKVLYAARLLWGASSGFVRLSVLCLYYRLLNECHGNRYIWVLHLTTAFTIALLVTYLSVGAFACTPIHAFWDDKPEYYCIDDRLYMFIIAIVNTISEFVLALLPVFAVFKLGVAPRSRLTVISLLSLGFFVTIAGCFRTYYVYKIHMTYDVTWYATPQWICSEIEIDIALMGACATPLRPILGRLYNRLVRCRTVSSKQKRIPGTSGTNTSLNSQVHLQARNDRDAMAEWDLSLLRAIDLEGLDDDGLGYTVTIVGPHSQGEIGGKTTPRWMWRIGKKKTKSSDAQSVISAGSHDENNQTRASQDSGAHNASGFEITARTSLRIDESYRNMNALERRLRLKKVTGWDPENGRLENHTTNLDFIGEGIPLERFMTMESDLTAEDAVGGSAAQLEREDSAAPDEKSQEESK